MFDTANQPQEDANFTNQYYNNGNMIQKTAKTGGANALYVYDNDDIFLALQALLLGCGFLVKFAG